MEAGTLAWRYHIYGASNKAPSFYSEHVRLVTLEPLVTALASIMLNVTLLEQIDVKGYHWYYNSVIHDGFSE